jgi:hypothetical protein
VISTSRDREVGWVRDLDLERRARDEVGGSARDQDRGQEPSRVRYREVTLPDTGPFGPPVTASFRFMRPMTIGSIVGMLATYSGVITASPGERAAVLGRAWALLERQFPGAHEIDVPMRAWCWRADRVVTGRDAGQSTGRRARRADRVPAEETYRSEHSGNRPRREDGRVAAGQRGHPTAGIGQHMGGRGSGLARQLGARGRAQAVSFAYRHGLAGSGNSATHC